MPRGTQIDRYIVEEYAKDFEITLETAREHRKRQSESWLSWCKRKKYNPNYLNADMKHQNNEEEFDELIAEIRIQPEPDFEQLPESLVERYKKLERKSYTQICRVQSLLDEAITNEQFQTLRVYVGGVKDLTQTFNELCRLRQIAEVQDGLLLPMEILERYKTHFYPRLNNGVEELRIAIENALPADMVADFQRAWQVSYYRYKDAAREAEAALNDYKEQAQSEALIAIDKKENAKHKAKSAAKAKLKNKKK